MEAGDVPAIIGMSREAAADGDAYVFAEDSADEALADYWRAPAGAAFVADGGAGTAVGVYKLVPNQPWRGAHVANASYLVRRAARGRGIGRALALHSLEEARRRGFRAMQFNLVVSTNAAAVALWRSLGFAVVGTLPQAFRHKKLSYVDAYVMHRAL